MKRMKRIIYIGGEKRQHLNGQGKESSDKQRATALVRHSQHRGCCARVSHARVALAAVGVPQLDASGACLPVMLVSFKDDLRPICRS